MQDKTTLRGIAETLRRSPTQLREVAGRGTSSGALMIQALERFIRHNPRSRLSLSDAASVLGYETTYCCKVFRRTTGKRFSEWDRDIRVRMAQEQLLRTNVSIGQIAEAVGYETISAFERSFKKVTGLAPSVWRSRQHE